MERRKFVIGMGALASGSAAAVGTGAFSSQLAERNVSVDVVDDAESLLSLQPGEYAELNDDTLSIDFTTTDEESETGLSPNATMFFRDVFTIKNQTDNDILIQVSSEDDLENVDGVEEAIIFEDEAGGGFTSGAGTDAEPAGDSLDHGGIDVGGNAGMLTTSNSSDVERGPILEPGDYMRVGFYFKTESPSDGGVSVEDVDLIVAGVDVSDGTATENTAW